GWSTKTPANPTAVRIVCRHCREFRIELDVLGNDVWINQSRVGNRKSFTLVSTGRVENRYGDLPASTRTAQPIRGMVVHYFGRADWYCSAGARSILRLRISLGSYWRQTIILVKLRFETS